MCRQAPATTKGKKLRLSGHSPSHITGSSIRSRRTLRPHCLSNTNVSVYDLPWAFVPFTTVVMVLPSGDTVRVTVEAILPSCLFVMSTVLVSMTLKDCVLPVFVPDA